MLRPGLPLPTAPPGPHRLQASVVMARRVAVHPKIEVVWEHECMEAFGREDGTLGGQLHGRGWAACGWPAGLERAHRRAGWGAACCRTLRWGAQRQQRVSGMLDLLPLGVLAAAGIHIRNRHTGEESDLPVGGLFFAIGEAGGRPSCGLPGGRAVGLGSQANRSQGGQALGAGGSLLRCRWSCRRCWMPPGSCRPCAGNRLPGGAAGAGQRRLHCHHTRQHRHERARWVGARRGGTTAACLRGAALR